MKITEAITTGAVIARQHGIRHTQGVVFARETDETDKPTGPCYGACAMGMALIGHWGRPPTDAELEMWEGEGARAVARNFINGLDHDAAEEVLAYAVGINDELLYTEEPGNFETKYRSLAEVVQLMTPLETQKEIETRARRRTDRE